MKQMIKKLFTVAILLSATFPTWGAYDFEVGGIYYEINSDGTTVSVTHGEQFYSGSVEIPSKVTRGVNYLVTSIGEIAFRGCNGLTSVTIHNSVTSIGSKAFMGCSGLTSVTIPNSVTKIGYDAFINCTGLKSVNISNSVTTIEQGTFAYCSGLTSVTIPKSVTSIGKEAFTGCSGLTSVTIPNSVTEIGVGAFSGCSGLTSVTIPNSVTLIDGSAFYKCSGLTSATIPNSVTEIGGNAFYGCIGLTSLTIGNSVTSIGRGAFERCSGLTLVTIPNSVTSIGEAAFRNCSSLTKVTIPNSVTSVGEYAFYVCSALTKVVISDIAAWCNISFCGYYSNPLMYAHHLYLNEEEVTNLVIPNSVTSIGNYAFYNCTGLTSVIIPNSVTEIGAEAFYGCSGLTKVEISDIAAWCNIRFVNGSNPLIYAKHLYLNKTEVINLVIPNSVSSIGSDAFRDCCGLTSVTIPNSVTSIGDRAFLDCSRLTSVTIPNSVTSIGVSAFKYCSRLTSLTIPNSVTSIGSKAFMGCSGLTSVTIPNSVTEIGNEAFYGCSGLTKVEISDISAWCNIRFGNSTSNPLCNAEHLYLNETEVTNLVIPNSVTSIGDYAFYASSGLTSVTIPNSVSSIGTCVFSGCGRLTSVTIPNSVTSIGEYAFAYCRNLEKVRFNATIRNVPTNNVFSSTKDLLFIVGEEVVSIPNNIVYNGGNGGVSKVIALADTPPKATSETFDSSVTSSAPLYVKKNTINKYFLADGWCDFINTQAISKPVTHISLNKTFLNPLLGESFRLKATVEPADATFTDLFWCTSNSCVSVDQDGNVKGLSEGQCVVTAEAIDGSGIRGECIVYVGNIYAESISLSKEVVALDINGLTKLSYTILPEYATIKDVECSSSDESVAVCKVNSDKTITVLGLSAGVATITVCTTDGSNRSASCVIYVGDSGAETIASDSVKVTTEGGDIRISGAAGAVAEVYSLSGALLYRGTDATIAMPRGVYIVKVAGTTNKVML